MATRGVFMTMCVVLSDFPFARCKLVQISMTLSEMSEDLLAVFKRSNSTSIMSILLMRILLTTF
jgi:hypothetical protein